MLRYQEQTPLFRQLGRHSIEDLIRQKAIGAQRRPRGCRMLGEGLLDRGSTGSNRVPQDLDNGAARGTAIEIVGQAICKSGFDGGAVEDVLFRKLEVGAVEWWGV